jgi:hypothetical protein
LLWAGALTLLVLGAGGLGYMQLVTRAYLPYNKYDHRQRGTLKLGAKAQNVALKMYDGSETQLASLWKAKPLFLVFGSCT